MRYWHLSSVEGSGVSPALQTLQVPPPAVMGMRSSRYVSPVAGLNTPKVAIVCVWDCEPLAATCTVSIWYSVRMKPVMLEKVVAEQLARLCNALKLMESSGTGDVAACETNSRPVRKNVRRTIVTKVCPQLGS
jgi:hypothetical protein